MARHPERDNDQYSETETQQRFEKLVRRALNTRPKPLKTMGPKGMPSQSKKRRKRAKRRLRLCGYRAGRQLGTVFSMQVHFAIPCGATAAAMFSCLMLTFR